MAQSDLSRTIETIGGTVRKMRSGKRASYGLTPLGKIKAEEYGLSGYNWEVLNDLDDNGPSSRKEISDRTHIPIDKVKVVLSRLIADGYIKKMSQND